VRESLLAIPGTLQRVLVDFAERIRHGSQDWTERP
jgi:hypothetical protein